MNSLLIILILQHRLLIHKQRQVTLLREVRKLRKHRRNLHNDKQASGCVYTRHPIHNLDPDERKKLLQFYLNSSFVKVSSEERGACTFYVVNYKDNVCNKKPLSWWQVNQKIAWARGLLLIKHENGNVEVKAVIPKFHSYVKHDGIILKGIKGLGDNLTVMPKPDGTLVYGTVINGEVVFWTRNGFTSPQASKYVREILKEDDLKVMREHPGWLFGWELIHHKDLKVEDKRGNDHLVLLHVETSAGYTYPQNQLEDIAKMFSATVLPIKCTTMSGETLHRHQSVQNKYPVSEGYVLVYNGERYKVKKKAYLMFANGLPFYLESQGKHVTIHMRTPSRANFRAAVNDSDVVPSYPDYMLSVGNVSTHVIRELGGLQTIKNHFKTKLGELLFQSMVEEWDTMKKEWEKMKTQHDTGFQNTLYQVKEGVEKTLSSMSTFKHIFTQKDTISEKDLQVILLLKRELHTNMFCEENRRKFYDSDKFVNEMRKQTKPDFPLQAPKK